MSIRGAVEYPGDPIDVDVRDGRLWVTLRDGRIIATPIAWYSRIQEAVPEQLLNIEVGYDGIRFPELDEDLEIKWMFFGQSDPNDLI